MDLTLFTQHVHFLNNFLCAYLLYQLDNSAEMVLMIYPLKHLKIKYKGLGFEGQVTDPLLQSEDFLIIGLSEFQNA